MNDVELQKSWRTAIGSCSHKFTDLHESFHRQSIGLMTDVTRIAMDRSAVNVFKSEEATVWIVAIEFEPHKFDLENLSRYAIGVYDLTGINWVRVAYNDKRWNLKTNQKQTLGE